MSVPKIISERCELAKLCDIRVFFKTHYRLLMSRDNIIDNSDVGELTVNGGTDVVLGAWTGDWKMWRHARIFPYTPQPV